MKNQHDIDPVDGLNHLIQTMIRLYGYDLSVFDPPFLQKTVKNHMKLLGADTIAGYINVIHGDRNTGERLIGSLRNEYSEFFRNALTYALLEYRIVPALATIAGTDCRNEIRIWSAGCSSGQEPYSLAILMLERLRLQRDAIKFRIFATDISSQALEAAREGTYDASQMGNVPVKHLERYFHKQGEHFTIDPSVKEFIEFAEFNLLDTVSMCPPSSIFGDFDIVVCCNVLMYYSAEIRQAISAKLIRSVAPSGYLVVGDAEQNLLPGAEVRVVFHGTSIFKKNVRKSITQCTLPT